MLPYVAGGSSDVTRPLALLQKQGKLPLKISAQKRLAEKKNKTNGIENDDRHSREWPLIGNELWQVKAHSLSCSS